MTLYVSILSVAAVVAAAAACVDAWRFLETWTGRILSLIHISEPTRPY